MTDSITIVPDYDENPAQAAEYLRQAIPLIAELNIPANPINYSIYYEYVSGKNEKLREHIDSILEKDGEITPAMSEQLFKEYVLNGSAEKYEKVGSGLKQLVAQTMDHVETTGDKANLFSDQFTQHSQALKNSNDPNSVQSVVDTIISETQQLAQASGELRNQLKQTTGEVDQLRKELANMKEAAETDPLTGLVNRRVFDKEIGRLVNEAENHKNSTCLLLIDLDHFKRINDSFGHLVGDKVLRYTSALLKQFVKEGDTAGRYGGEEMAILLPNRNTQQALEIANNIRESLAKSRLQRKDNGEPIGQVTLSIGVAFLKPDDTVESFIERADTALYKAKSAGRNRVLVGDKLTPVKTTHGTLRSNNPEKQHIIDR